MTYELALWMQNSEYAARLDRHFIEQVLHGAERVFEGLEMTQASPSPNFTIQVGPGSLALKGDDITFQGMYFARNTATKDVSVPATPGSGTRTDSIVATLTDSQALGGGSDAWFVEVIEGTTLGDTQLLLGAIARDENETAILQAAMTDLRPVGAYPYTVATANPPAGIGVEGDLWIVVAP